MNEPKPKLLMRQCDSAGSVGEFSLFRGCYHIAGLIIKKQYDEAFRRNAVALLESSARPLREIAAELGVSHWNLRDWTKKHGRNQPKPAATAAEMQGEMARLRRENQSLAARCDVLKKALGILAEPSANASRA